ncbi:anonymous antigen-7 like protein [Babesia caballi]|uniref:Anonymous antigen-7 like protein n=1 Tax=Babesia caballi TaxID=5871 RepID=A0AAV4M2R4_BABCB|nr:anonymous antigen-7 like protein [Babesia caballi]
MVEGIEEDEAARIGGAEGGTGAADLVALVPRLRVTGVRSGLRSLRIPGRCIGDGGTLLLLHRFREVVGKAYGGEARYARLVWVRRVDLGDGRGFCSIEALESSGVCRLDSSDPDTRCDLCRLCLVVRGSSRGAGGAAGGFAVAGAACLVTVPLDVAVSCGRLLVFCVNAVSRRTSGTLPWYLWCGTDRAILERYLPQRDLMCGSGAADEDPGAEEAAGGGPVLEEELICMLERVSKECMGVSDEEAKALLRAHIGRGRGAMYPGLIDELESLLRGRRKCSAVVALHFVRDGDFGLYETVVEEFSASYTQTQKIGKLKPTETQTQAPEAEGEDAESRDLHFIIGIQMILDGLCKTLVKSYGFSNQLEIEAKNIWTRYLTFVVENDVPIANMFSDPLTKGQKYYVDAHYLKRSFQVPKDIEPFNLPKRMHKVIRDMTHTSFEYATVLCMARMERQRGAAGQMEGDRQDEGEGDAEAAGGDAGHGKKTQAHTYDYAEVKAYLEDTEMSSVLENVFDAKVELPRSRRCSPTGFPIYILAEVVMQRRLPMMPWLPTVWLYLERTNPYRIAFMMETLYRHDFLWRLLYAYPNLEPLPGFERHLGRYGEVTTAGAVAAIEKHPLEWDELEKLAARMGVTPGEEKDGPPPGVRDPVRGAAQVQVRRGGGRRRAVGAAGARPAAEQREPAAGADPKCGVPRGADGAAHALRVEPAGGDGVQPLHQREGAAQHAAPGADGVAAGRVRHLRRPERGGGGGAAAVQRARAVQAAGAPAAAAEQRHCGG